ncbi:MAG TPA: CPBP family intramembrane metalloprotease [Cyclobacteriaceae bacterium]|nr:CPBP family intramembrane metalloprotease [Cyclobacteriaceae bacterium]HPW60831.1 CPBP family intramembrane metalloprotease [Cyclobacteriaceae bacterium]HRG78878.1 CPBP family intramembrane metalloprotease [Cyclobacteriaceae bacterium]
MNQLSNTAKILFIFIILFGLYHAAEYLIVFQNNAAGFLLVQFAFFVTAYFLGRWYSGDGLSTWGLPLKGRKNFLVGVACGVLIYGASYLVSIHTGVESITKVPDWITVVKASAPFAFGVLLSSFSEDILTRGLVYAHFKNKLQPIWLVSLSAIVYVLNHIYRLGDGIEPILYLFLLGVIFFIPLLRTKNLWLTGFMHWSGNTFFFIFHNVIQTESSSDLISPNYLFSICLIFFIPIVWFVSKAYLKEEVPH